MPFNLIRIKINLDFKFKYLLKFIIKIIKS